MQINNTYVGPMLKHCAQTIIIIFFFNYNVKCHDFEHCVNLAIDIIVLKHKVIYCLKNR